MVGTSPFDNDSARSRDLAPTYNVFSIWMTYIQAAVYTGYSVRYLRNLVSADAIPVYGPARSRRFRRDVLDIFLTDRDAAMRKFRLERQAQRGN
jgi:excisionase family DNA binding protein